MPRHSWDIKNIVIPHALCSWDACYIRSHPTPAPPTWPWACPSRPVGDTYCARISLGSRAEPHIAERSMPTRYACHTISVHAKVHTGARTHVHRHNMQHESVSTRQHAHHMTETIVAHLAIAPRPSSPIAAPPQKARSRAETVCFMFTDCECQHKADVDNAAAAAVRSTRRPRRVAAALPGRPPRPTQRERGDAERSCQRDIKKARLEKDAQRRWSRPMAAPRPSIDFDRRPARPSNLEPGLETDTAGKVSSARFRGAKGDLGSPRDGQGALLGACPDGPIPA